jgi:hypothetical protein
MTKKGLRAIGVAGAALAQCLVNVPESFRRLWDAVLRDLVSAELAPKESWLHYRVALALRALVTGGLVDATVLCLRGALVGLALRAAVPSKPKASSNSSIAWSV